MISCNIRLSFDWRKRVIKVGIPFSIYLQAIVDIDMCGYWTTTYFGDTSLITGNCYASITNACIDVDIPCQLSFLNRESQRLGILQLSRPTNFGLWYFKSWPAHVTQLTKPTKPRSLQMTGAIYNLFTKPGRIYWY